jgi:hypothetical protein
MHRQIIQNFLNLSGIVGVALVDGRNRPFFLGHHIRLNTQQQDALAQGIQQVVETTPADFDTFAFRFTHQLIYIHRLDQGVILMVMTSDKLPLREYRAAVNELKATLSEDLYNAVPTFRLLAGCVTLGGGESVPKGNTDKLSDASSPNPPAPSQGKSTNISCQQVIGALNHLSDASSQVLGKTIVTNGWKSSCPNVPWLKQFEIQKSAHFTYTGPTDAPITAEQQQQLQAWVQAFMGRCGRTFRNFQAMVVEKNLTPAEKIILLSKNSD